MRVRETKDSRSRGANGAVLVRDGRENRRRLATTRAANADGAIGRVSGGCAGRAYPVSSQELGGVRGLVAGDGFNLGGEDVDGVRVSRELVHLALDAHLLERFARVESRQRLGRLVLHLALRHLLRVRQLLHARAELAHLMQDVVALREERAVDGVMKRALAVGGVRGHVLGAHQNFRRRPTQGKGGHRRVRERGRVGRGEIRLWGERNASEFHLDRWTAHTRVEQCVRASRGRASRASNASTASTDKSDFLNGQHIRAFSVHRRPVEIRLHSQHLVSLPRRAGGMGVAVRCAACFKAEAKRSSAPPFLRCPMCDAVAYCDAACRKRHLPRHRERCRLTRLERGWNAPAHPSATQVPKDGDERFDAAYFARYAPPGGWEQPDARAAVRSGKIPATVVDDHHHPKTDVIFGRPIREKEKPAPLASADAGSRAGYEPAGGGWGQATLHNPRVRGSRAEAARR